MIVLIAEVIGSLPNCMSTIEEQRLSTYNIQNAFTWWWAVWWEQLSFSFARLSMVNTKIVTNYLVVVLLLNVGAGLRVTTTCVGAALGLVGTAGI